MKPGFAFKRATEVSGAAVQDSAAAAVRTDSSRPQLRRGLFVLGDVLFLLLVSVVATAAMHVVHELGWNLAFTLICGMAGAMLVQIRWRLEPLRSSAQGETHREWRDRNRCRRH